MKYGKHVIGLLGCCVASQIAAQDQKLNYPPVAAPLYFKCKMQDVGGGRPNSNWHGMALHFPNGTGGTSPELRIVDRHSQLEGGKFRFHIKAGGHWSLIDSNGVPSADMVKSLPQIMFLPPSGNGETYRIYFMKNGEPVRGGFCVGMIGPNTTAAFEKSLADPSVLD